MCACDSAIVGTLSTARVQVPMSKATSSSGIWMTVCSPATLMPCTR